MNKVEEKMFERNFSMSLMIFSLAEPEWKDWRNWSEMIEKWEMKLR